MATSGTTTFTLQIDDIIDEALDRCGGEVTWGQEPRSARRSLNLLLTEWSNRGINLWTVEQDSIAVSASAGASIALDQDVVDIMDMVVAASDGSDLGMTRIGYVDWLRIPNKEQVGRPTQWFVERQRDQPVLRTWPLAEDNFTFKFWKIKRIQDIKQSFEDPDVPYRFLPALTAGLAYYMSLKRSVPLDRVAVLKAQYEEALLYASQEDRERVSFKAIPKIPRV